MRLLWPQQGHRDKLSAARQLKPLFGEEREIIVDGLDGAIHQAFSSCAPNAVYVINPLAW